MTTCKDNLVASLLGWVLNLGFIAVVGLFVVVAWTAKRLGMTDEHIDRVMGIDETEQREKSQ